MLKIRLQRVGRRNHPSFRVVVTESQRGPKSGDFIENVGSYNPHTNEVVLAGDRIKHWLDNGAQASGTVHNLLVGNNVIEGKKVNVLPKKTPIVKEEEETPEASKEESTTEEAPVAEEAVVEEEAPASVEKAEEEAPKEE